jgi:hypothetical protein
MGLDADKQLHEEPALNLDSSRCCCGVVKIRTAAYLIALFEILFVLYHLFLAFWNYGKVGDEYVFSFVLGIFCMFLALVAIVLMLVGIRKSSAYFLVPHLLMQFATIVSWTLLAGYLIVLMVGGTSIKINGVIYEDSEKGRTGLASVDRRDPIVAQLVVPSLNIIFVLILGLTVLCIAIQIWFFTLIRRCFSLLSRIRKDSKANCCLSINS